MGKDKSRRKVNKKAIVILFAILCIAVAGVVLGVTYWPAKPADISMSFQTYLNEAVYDQESDMNEAEVEISSFRRKYRPEFIHYDMADYANEMDSLDYIISSVNSLSKFYETNFESIFSDKIAKRDAKKLDGYLKDIKLSVEKIGKHIVDHKEEMIVETEDGNKKVNFTVVSGVWTAVRSNYQDIVSNAVEMTALLQNFNKMKMHGVFGNQMYCNVVDATHSYLSVIQEKFFNTDGFADSAVGMRASMSLATFARNYYEIFQEAMSRYSIDETIKSNATALSLLESKTENKINYDYLILNNFVYADISLSAEQAKYVSLAVDFLKGDVR